MLRKVMVLAAVSIVAVTNIKYGGYEKHWWWDNVGHFASGFVVGVFLPEGREREYYFAIAVLWEILEWRLAVMELWRRFDVPEGPRALGFSGWDVDKQVEDTILDTVMGWKGVQLARMVK